MHVAKVKIPEGYTPDEFRWETLRIAGVSRVEVNTNKRLARIASDRPIALHELPQARKAAAVCETGRERPSFMQLVGLFAVVLILGQIASRFGWLRPSVALGASTSVFAVFLLGLVAASSSCIAVAGGLMLSAIASQKAKMKTVMLFVGGRLASYAVLGGVIGGIGSALSPSPYVVGIITIVAAVYMLAVGLDMLHIAPKWLRRFTPKMPLALGRKVMDKEESKHPFAPALLGAGTFFLPCGFTQALQLYALTTGSIATSASVMFAFALGTAPSLLALGWASNSLKGKAGTWFFKFSGALVIVLGLWNIQNGMTITGYPIALPQFNFGRTEVAIAAGRAVTDPNVSFDGNTQSVGILVDYGGYSPNRFTLRSGVPTRLNFSGPAAGEGCLGILQIPKLGVRKRIVPDATTPVEFTPTAPGRYAFSCSMGMFRGSFDVI